MNRTSLVVQYQDSTKITTKLGSNLLCYSHITSKGIGTVQYRLNSIKEPIHKSHLFGKQTTLVALYVL